MKTKCNVCKQSRMVMLKKVDVEEFNRSDKSGSISYNNTNICIPCFLALFDPDVVIAISHLPKEMVDVVKE